jgi:sugar phosphate isomerase/epimerase
VRVGISTASLFSRLPNEDAVRFFDEIGVKDAEVFLTSFCEYDEAFGKLINERKGQVRVHSVHVLNTQFEPQLFSAYERTKNDAFFWLGKAMSAAREFGATHYTFHGTARYKKAARSGKNDDFSSIAKGIEEIVDFCKGFGVELCLENVEWATYNRPGVFSKISEGVPQMKGVLDIKQARISEYPYHLYLEEMGEKLAYVHISDIDEKGKMCLPGKGVFNFAELIKRLQDVGFDGALIIEVYENDYKTEEELKTSCEYMQELLYKNAK